LPDIPEIKIDIPEQDIEKITEKVTFIAV